MNKILPIILLSSFKLFSLSFDFEFNGLNQNIKKTFEITDETKSFNLTQSDLNFEFLINSTNLEVDQRVIDLKVLKTTNSQSKLILNPTFLITLENLAELKTDDIDMKVKLRS
ncbi:MAG: hypothetical protein P4L22_04520 [Candidatus Babeliales bacterium]|nr:hypothetical protein [Candidatus Babeliales bacterium]